MDTKRPIYRVRRGWLGRAILQKLVSLPTLVGGQVDAHNRESKWVDVPYHYAPPVLQAFPPEEPRE